MEPGSKVMIHQNSHHPGAMDISDTVAGIRPGEGFGGLDLIDICYRHPKTRKRQTKLPTAPASNLPVSKP